MKKEMKKEKEECRTCLSISVTSVHKRAASFRRVFSLSVVNAGGKDNADNSF